MRHTHLGRAAAVLLATVAIAIAAHPSQANSEREVAGTVNRVQHMAHASWQNERHKLDPAMPVRSQDLLTTQGDSLLHVTLLDGTDITLSENASLKIDRSIFDADNGDRIVWLKRNAGAFLLAVNSIAGAQNDEVVVATASGTIGIRGTTVWAGQIDGGYGVFSIDGAVSVSTQGQEVILQSGQGVTIIDPAIPVPVVSWGAGKIGRALATVTFEN